jgi:hypothetical protein
VGRLIRSAAVALALAALVPVAAPFQALGFDGFGTPEADARFGEELVFSVDLNGDEPERLELLLWFGDDETVFVAPVSPDQGRATYRWDASRDYVVPNTPIRHQWRAIDGGEERLSRAGELLYDDDRPSLDWRRAGIGEATVHWYGGAEAVARRLGELSAEGARRAEELLGHELSAAVDIFCYQSRDDFFAALGPGQREWTGAATYPAHRTIFMWLEAGDMAYLETTIVHEVTHVVFYDATSNPYHSPARWINEGIAVWSEEQGAAAQRSLVQAEASGPGLLAFDAIEAVFPISGRGSSLAYAQSATFVDTIIDEHGTDAIAALATAYRGGATDGEALEAATGRSAEELYDAFFAAFGVDRPERVEPRPILPSIVDTPRLIEPEPAPSAPILPGSPNPDGAPIDGWLVVVPLVVAAAIAVVLLWLRSRRGAAA